jgi:hypothetical protein
MPKPRFTIPIAHADDVATIKFTVKKWQAIQRAYGRKLNTEVRQRITTVTKHYLKDCVFDRTAAPKKMAQKLIRHRRRAAGNLEKAMSDSEPFSASFDELSREQQQSARSYADGLIRRHLDDRRSRARDKLYHFRLELKSYVVACDGALNDAARGYRDDEAWGWWIQELTRIAGQYGLPTGVSTELDRNGRPLPFVRLVRELERYLTANARPRKRSPAALAMAISRARNT